MSPADGLGVMTVARVAALVGGVGMTGLAMWTLGNSYARMLGPDSRDVRSAARMLVWATGMTALSTAIAAAQMVVASRAAP